MTAPDGGLVAVRAPAKINLFLHVVGRRPDGYHLLDSLVVFADAHDMLTVSPAETLRLELDGPFAHAIGGRPDENLALRAARLLRDRLGVAAGARIRLTKNLPVAAGIGGGSADAAAVLRALCTLWDVSPGEEELAALALRLGADVPVCLTGQPTRVRGIGDILEPAGPLPPCALVLTNPGTALATADVFRMRREGAATAPRTKAAPSPAAFHDLPDAAALADRLATYGNDLADAATALVPDIGPALAALAGTDGCLLARLSGSGATCFGLYADAASAAAAAARIADERPGWWTVATRLAG